MITRQPGRQQPHGHITGMADGDGDTRALNHIAPEIAGCVTTCRATTYAIG
jgi:hypothetical protein